MPMSAHGRPMGAHGRPWAPMGRPWGAQGRPGAPMGRPGAPHGAPMGAHRAPMGAHGAPMGAPGPHGGPSGPGARNLPNPGFGHFFNFWVCHFKILGPGARWWALLWKFLYNQVLRRGLMGSRVDSGPPLARSGGWSLSGIDHTRPDFRNPSVGQIPGSGRVFLNNLVSGSRSRAEIHGSRTNSAARVVWWV